MTAGSRMRRTIAGPDSRNTRPTSTILRSTDSTAPITPRYTGKNTPTAIRMVGVDQIVNCCGYDHIRRHDCGLLQGQPGRQDRFPLGSTDAVMSELSAILQLLVD